MQTTQGNKLLFRFFEGALKEITLAVDKWCLEDGANFDVVAVEYNYQAPELDGRSMVQEAHHGVLLVLRMLTINERREREGLTPFRSGDAENQGIPEHMPDGSRGSLPWLRPDEQPALRIMKPFCVGDVVRYIGITASQVSWGNADDPRRALTEGDRYIVEDVDIHAWHTRIKLHRVEGSFNSVCFEETDIHLSEAEVASALAHGD